MKAHFRIIYIIGFILIFHACQLKWDLEPIPDEAPPCPEITSISPTTGRAGDIVTISGKNFGTFLRSRDEIRINDKKVEVVENQAPTETELVITIPSGLGSGSVVVEINNCNSSDRSVIPTFTYLQANITSISPDHAKAGETLTITGEFFRAGNPNAHRIKFANQEATSNTATDNTLTVIVPEGAGSGEISIVLDGLESSGPRFTYIYTGIISTVAGSGDAGYKNDIRSAALFDFPTGITYNLIDKQLYVADQQNHEIRSVDPQSGEVDRYAGFFQDQRSDTREKVFRLSARFNFPIDITSDNQGNLYISDRNNSRIRSIIGADVFICAGPENIIGAFGLAVNEDQELFMTDNWDNKVSRFECGNSLTPVLSSSLNEPAGIMNIGDSLVIADRENCCLKIVDISTGNMRIFAGEEKSCNFSDGNTQEARFRKPYGLAQDNEGNIYVSDFEDHRIRMITPTRQVFTLCGTGQFGFKNGESGTFENPAGITYDPNENCLYVADANNNAIRKIELK